MPQDEMSNNKLSKFLSAEILGSMLVTAFLVGVTYQSLAKDVSATDGKVATVEKKYDRMEDNVTRIQVDMAVVKTNQENIKTDIDKQNVKLREQGQDIKEILRLLQRNGGHVP